MLVSDTIWTLFDDQRQQPLPGFGVAGALTLAVNLPLSGCRP